MYLDQVITPAGDGAVIAVTQSAHDALRAYHPETSEPVRHVCTTPHLPLRHGEAATRTALSDASIAGYEFTRGVHECRGPDVKISGDVTAPGVRTPGG